MKAQSGLRHFLSLTVWLAIAVFAISRGGHAQTSIGTPAPQQQTRLFASRSQTPDFAGAAAAFEQRARDEGRISLIVELALPEVIATKDIVWNAAVAAHYGALVTSAQQQLAASVGNLPAGFPSPKPIDGLPFVQLWADASVVDKVFALPQVASVGEEAQGQPFLNNTIPQIHADIAFNLGATGSGQTVAVLDSGVDTTHPFFAGKIVSQACYSSSDPVLAPLCAHGLPSGSTAPGSGDPCTTYPDECWHGTHMAGVAVGTSTVTGGYVLRGVGTQSSLIAIQMHSQTYNCYPSSPCLTIKESDVVAGLNRVYALRNVYNIASVNMSFGYINYFAYQCDNAYPLTFAAINQLVAANVAVVAASGNNGAPPYSPVHAAQMPPPACMSNVISVGSVAKDDTFALYSNANSYTSLLAPGGYCPLGTNDPNCGIRSSLPGGIFDNKRTFQVGGVTQLTGTSQAAAHVSGAIAALRTLYPLASPAALKTQLQNTGVPKNYSEGGSNFTTPRIALDSATHGPPAPGLLTMLRVRSDYCRGGNTVSWSPPGSGTVTEYHVQGSYTNSFTNPFLLYVGSNTSVDISVSTTTYIRALACNLVSCSAWVISSAPATYYNGCQ